MVLLIDNYDSFSYNLFQLVGTITPNIKVVRNDEMTIDEIAQLNPSHIILSPGPGKPSDAGICEDVVREFAGKIPIMGVCLGHQAICEVYGATVTYAKRLMHGKSSMCSMEPDVEIFKGLYKEKIGTNGEKEKSSIKVARYHSLSAKKETIPEELRVIAVADDDGEIMAVKHRDYKVYGLQFHPESILTPDGIQILKNFLSVSK